jgi:hypothetical protein
MKSFSLFLTFLYSCLLGRRRCQALFVPTRTDGFVPPLCRRAGSARVIASRYSTVCALLIVPFRKRAIQNTRLYLTQSQRLRGKVGKGERESTNRSSNSCHNLMYRWSVTKRPGTASLKRKRTKKCSRMAKQPWMGTTNPTSLRTLQAVGCNTHSAILHVHNFLQLYVG